jgi:hypothetical protein
LVDCRDEEEEAKCKEDLKKCENKNETKSVKWVMQKTKLKYVCSRGV